MSVSPRTGIDRGTPLGQSIAALDGWGDPFGVTVVPALFVVFAFVVLTFLASAATLALEPSSQPGGIWNVVLVFLAALNAASGFVVLGGVQALNEGLWRVVAACTAAGLVSAVVTTLATRYLAAILELRLSPTTARQAVSLALAAGIVVLLIVLKLNRLPSE